MINTSANMDSHAMDNAFKYILDHFDKSDGVPYFEVYMAYKKLENKVIPGDAKE